MLPQTSPLAGRVIGVVPQSASTALTPVRTIASQREETCRALGAQHTPSDLLLQVGLREGDGRLYPHELSGGMAQRAAVAFAIAGDPALLLADEPTSALDPDLTAQLWMLLREHADRGAVVLVVTHDIEELERSEVADDITIMLNGNAVEHGLASDILRKPAHPYSRRLIAALPSRGMKIDELTVTTSPDRWGGGAS